MSGSADELSARAGDRIRRGNRRALLTAEAALLLALRGHARAATLGVVTAIALAGESDAERAKRAALRATADGRRLLTAHASAAILHGRQRARRAASDRLGVELHAAGASLPARRPDDAPEDEVRADAVGASFGAAWASAIAFVTLGWSANPRGSLAKQAARVTREQDYRLGRIAATETASAYNAEHRAAVREIADRHRGEPWASALRRQWDATLDRRTCETCEALDGQIVRLDEPFRGGAEPGDVHPMCRCVETLISIH